jgi:phospholipid-binding lipoprotein MlaA
VSGKNGASKIDPLMSVNQTTYRVMESVDKAIVAPIAKGYRKQVPSPIRRGLHNFFFNLNEPVNAINFVLQLKPLSALKTVGRFGLNSTIGVGGLLDVAKTKPFKLHYRPNGLGNTFGYYGIGPGRSCSCPASARPAFATSSARSSTRWSCPLPWAAISTRPGSSSRRTSCRRSTIAWASTRISKRSAKRNPYIYYRQLYFRNRFEEIEALHGRGPLARGQIGMAPFAHPLYPEPTPPALVPEPAGAARPSWLPLPQAQRPVGRPSGRSKRRPLLRPLRLPGLRRASGGTAASRRGLIAKKRKA